MRGQLTSWLNRVSMYRLMSIALSTLWVSSIILSIVGTLDYSPLALLVSGLVLIVVTTFANIGLGRLFGVQIHTESSYITALILLFILPPSLTVMNLAALSLAGIIASASKYILASHGRHIFNPAAIGALLISIVGLASPTWWVGTPTLLPVTLLLSVLILYKTNRLGMGAVFIACAIPATLVVLMGYGTPFGEAVILLPSWPLLFFVGFMLSEPLTLPPRKWQQFLEAAIVGILFALPLQVGFNALNPAAALLIGNIIAYYFSYRRRISLTLVEKKTLTPSVQEYRFRPAQPIAFESGQYMEITVPHKRKDARGLRRSFSITSAPGDELVTFGIRHYQPSSTFKRALHDLPLGSIIPASSIGGSFTLPRDPAVPLLFIAGGIGITPFISQLQALATSEASRDIVLFYAVSSEQEIAYRDILRGAGITVVIVAPSLPVGLPTDNWRYVDAPFITEEIIRAYAPDATTRHAYIAGSPELVRSVKRDLKTIKLKRITTDYFTGY